MLIEPTLLIRSVDERKVSFMRKRAEKSLPPCLPDAITAAVSTTDFWTAFLAAFIYKILPCSENEAHESLQQDPSEISSC